MISRSDEHSVSCLDDGLVGWSVDCFNRCLSGCLVDLHIGVVLLLEPFCSSFARRTESFAPSTEGLNLFVVQLVLVEIRVGDVGESALRIGSHSACFS